MSLKVLVAGDVDGRFKALFDRVESVNKRAGPFHLLLVAGNFFSPDADGESEPPPPAPIPTLILGPVASNQLPLYHDLNGCDISETITYLGRSGVYNEASGLRIAYLSGTQYDGPSSSRPPVSFNFEDVKNLRVRLENESNFRGVDILLTHQWPGGVETAAAIKPEEKPGSPSTLVALLAAALKPRYHFAAGGEDMNYERAPYRNHEVLAEAATHCSRFISLAKVGNAKKRKWLYAFNVSPMSHMKKEELLQEPPSITANPYAGSSHQDHLGGGGGPGAIKTAASSQFFYDTSYTGERGGRGGGRGRGGRGKRPYHQGHGDGPPNGKRSQQGPPSACWFCLASPEVEKHLVVSIGESAYVTLAKGGLTEDHLLILPIGHFQSLLDCPPEVLEEIAKFKNSLKKYFESIGKDVLFFERNFKSPHLQVQVVPIPKSKCVGIKITCLDYAESEGIEMQEFPPAAELFQMTRPGFPYFYLELPDGTKLFSAIRQTFPIQFGRELAASEPLLDVPDRVDWKQCKASKEEETRYTSNVRNAFKPFDFTL